MLQIKKDYFIWNIRSFVVYDKVVKGATSFLTLPKPSETVFSFIHYSDKVCRKLIQKQLENFLLCQGSTNGSLGSFWSEAGARDLEVVWGSLYTVDIVRCKETQLFGIFLYKMVIFTSLKIILKVGENLPFLSHFFISI